MVARLGKLPAVLVPITTPVLSTIQASLMLMPMTYYEHGVRRDAQLGTYNESVSGTYGHVHDPACEPSAAYYDPGGYSDNSYGADDYNTAGGYDGGTGGGYDWDGYNGGYDDGGDDGDYGGDC